MHGKKNRILLVLVLISYSSCYSQQEALNVDPQLKRNTLGANIGIAALEAVLGESGLQVEFYYQRKFKKMFFIGVEQGFIIQDNFPSNFYPTNTAPFHLAPEVDAYIRSLTWNEAFDFDWTKSTFIYLSPFVGVNLLHYKRFSLAISSGIGVQYRNYTRFGLMSYVVNGEGEIVDYKELITINSVIAPILNVSFELSQKLTPTLAMQLNFKYNHELSNFEDPKNAGYSDYMALRLGISKKF